MLYFRNAKQTFIKNPTISVIVIIQLMIAVLLLNFLFIIVSNQNAEMNMTKKLRQEDGGFLGIYPQNHSSFSELENRFQGEIKIAGVKQTNININGEIIYLQALADELFDLINLSPAKGRIPRQSAEDGVIEILASFGKTGALYHTLLEGLQGDVAVTLKTVGETAYNFPYFDLKGSPVNMSNIFLWGKKNTDKVVLCRLSDFEKYRAFGAFRAARAVIIHDAVSDARVAEIKDSLLHAGFYTPFYDLADTSDTETSEILKPFAPYLVIILLLAIFDFAMTSALTASKNERALAIMSLTGARRRHLFFAAMSYGVLLAAIAAIPILIIINVFLPSLPLIRGALRPWILVLFSLGILGLFAGITILSSLASLRGRRLANILRRE